MTLVLPCNMDPDKMSERELRGEVKRLRSMEKERHESDHYGPFGPVCQNIGQFDAGECYICERNRLRQVVISKERQIDNMTVRCATLNDDAKKYKAHAGEMQLAAGRYQYLFEHAMKFINQMDDFFEYRYKYHSNDSIREIVMTHLGVFTEAAQKIKGGK